MLKRLHRHCVALRDHSNTIDVMNKEKRVAWSDGYNTGAKTQSNIMTMDSLRAKLSNDEWLTMPQLIQRWETQRKTIDICQKQITELQASNTNLLRRVVALEDDYNIDSATIHRYIQQGRSATD